MNNKNRIIAKISLLAILFGIFYGVQPTLNASYLCLLPEHISFTVEGMKDFKKLIHIKRQVVPSPNHHTSPFNYEEKVALLWKLKEQLERELTEENVSETDALEKTLAQVKKQLNREVERGIITPEQAKTTLENIEKGNFEKELEDLQDTITHQQKKQNAVNALQDTIASAFKSGNLNSQQADEMLVNLENGIWDMEKGGVVFDLKGVC
jgi:hypothetical protein